MANLKDTGHLFRMAAVFAAGIVLFLVLRGIFVPKTFGQYGHYRAAAMAEIAAKPVMFAGHQACESCHTDVLEVKSKGVHAQVACESCHGPLAKHADDPTALPAAEDGRRRALRPLPRSQHRQAQDFSAGGSGGALRRRASATPVTSRIARDRSGVANEHDAPALSYSAARRRRCLGFDPGGHTRGPRQTTTWPTTGGAC